MDILDLGALREIENRVTGGKALKPPLRPVHHKVTARASSHPLPHGLGIKPPKVVRKKKQQAQGVEDRLAALIRFQNKRA
jgi:hypothetical protein